MNTARSEMCGELIGMREKKESRNKRKFIGELNILKYPWPKVHTNILKNLRF
jgi:hypothetical protein